MQLVELILCRVKEQRLVEKCWTFYEFMRIYGELMSSYYEVLDFLRFAINIFLSSNYEIAVTKQIYLHGFRKSGTVYKIH